MKTLACLVSGLGVLALLLSIGEFLFHYRVLDVTHGGCLRAADTLFLFAIVLMLLERNYCPKRAAEKAAGS